MKKLAHFLTFFLISICPIMSSAQHNNHFDLLNGFEDAEGTTHLTFTFSTTDSVDRSMPDCSSYFFTYVDLIHLNTATLEDSVLITNNVGQGICGPRQSFFYDVDAVNNNPAKFVVAGSYSDGFEPYGYLHFLSTDAATYPLFASYETIYTDPKIQDTVFINVGSSYRPAVGIPAGIKPEHLGLLNYGPYDVSNDTLRKYFSLFTDFVIRGFSPFKDSVLFGEIEAGLVKSSDYGKTFETVDDSNYYLFGASYYGINNELYFDVDSAHIYRPVTINQNDSTIAKIVVSDNFGEAGSWVIKDGLSSHQFYKILPDPTTSGGLYGYSTDSKNIYYSSDYGTSFTILHTFDNNISSIYASSTDGSFYVLTSTELFQIRNEEITSLKQIPVSNEREPSEIPSKIILHQNYPNPFNPSTVISYQLSGNSLVRLEVFDVTGRKVAVLVDGERKSAGNHRVSFDGSGLSSGVYFYRLETGGQTLTKKMMLVK